MMSILTLVAFLGIIYGTVAHLLPKFNPKASLPEGGKVLSVSTVLFFVFLLINSTLYKITAQEVGVVITPKGVTKTPITTGWNFVAPWRVRLNHFK